MKEILFVPHPHFDPVWRRCFDRLAKKHGLTVRSYADVEELCINAWLKMAKYGYPFNDGQMAIWRKYLKRNPEKQDALRKEAQRGTLDLVRAGEVVPDTNMSTAEGLVRNFLVAQPLYQQLAPPDHPGLKLAWLEDAFGNSANYPQVLAGIGAEVVCCTTYRVCPDPIWVGLDGTRVFCFDHYPAVRRAGVEKHPPCPSCSGSGCPECDGTGMRLFPGFDLESMNSALKEAAILPGKWAVVYYLTEEILPDARLKGVLDAFNRRHRGKARARFANPSDIYRRYLPELRAIAAGWKKAVPTPELNPAMPGCMVTRIRCKQRTRFAAYLLVAAEAALATAAWTRRCAKRPPKDLAQAWRDVCFNQFHDAITGTHIDAAYDELMSMLDRAERIARRYVALPKAKPRSPKLSKINRFPARVQFGTFAITFDRAGILSILMGKRDVFGTLPGFSKLRRPVRIGELVLDPDFGDAWGQRIAPLGDATRVPLGDYQTTVEAGARIIRWRGRYRGGDPKVKKLEWAVTMSPSQDGQRLDFVTDVDWDTASRRLRVLVPVASTEETAVYEIPFGFISRKFEKEKLDYSQWRSNTMEFPTLHGERKTVGHRGGVAVLNKGLPCLRWMPGQFDLSLLRSPEWSFCAVEAGNYEFWDIDGQRDTGRHRFEYSIWPHNGQVTEHELTKAGYDYNRPTPLELPFRLDGQAIVTAWKLAESGAGWILRLQETSGRASQATLHFDRPVALTPTDLLERPLSASRISRRHRIALHKHGIKTVLLEFQRESKPPRQAHGVHMKQGQ